MSDVLRPLISVVCAWCREVVEAGEFGAVVSYGICAGCADQLASGIASHEAEATEPQERITSIEDHRRAHHASGGFDNRPVHPTGQPALILRRRLDHQRQCDGVVLSRDDEGALIEPVGEIEWVRGEGAVVVVLAPGQPLVAAAEFAGEETGAIVFRTLTPWRVLNRRRTPRASTNIRAQVQSTHGRMDVSLLDVSIGGLRLLTPEGIEDSEVIVELRALDHALQLTCSVLDTTELDDGFEARLRFGLITMDQRVALDRLVALLTSAARVSEVGPEWGWEIPDDDLTAVRTA